MEYLYNVLSLTFATSFLVGLLFNILYDSAHPDSYSQEKEVLLGFMALALIVGAASVRGRQSYKVISYFEAYH